MLVDLAQAQRGIQLRPERNARTEHDRMDDEAVLIDEAAAHELAGEVSTADLEVAGEFAPDVRQDGSDVTAYEACAVGDRL